MGTISVRSLLSHHADFFLLNSTQNLLLFLSAAGGVGKAPSAPTLSLSQLLGGFMAL